MLIIATVGPSTKDKWVISDMMEVGANALRLNFSHGDTKMFDEIIRLARGINRDVHIIQDLSGTKIRVSNKMPYIMKIYNGEEVTFCGEDIYKDIGYKINYNGEKVIPLNINNSLLEDKSLEEISMKDKTMVFKIQSISKSGIRAKVLTGGVVRAGKGCNIKGFSRKNMMLSEKDRNDIKWGLENEVDVICQSFVENIEDIIMLKNFIKSCGITRNMPNIWAKIETPKGVLNVEEIARNVEGIVIGRGDLVPEGALIDTPIYQEAIIKKVKVLSKEIIIGTHILNSMKSGRNAELSEVESIYNHIRSGVTGFLLAGETSVGKAPIKTVEFLGKLVKKYN